MTAGPVKKAPRVRLHVVFGLVACWLALSSAGLGGLWLYATWRTPAHLYARDFDSNLAQSQPQIWPAVKADPMLRQFMLERTQAAFLRGGWTESSTVFWQIVHARMEAFAGDDATLACHAAWQDVYRVLMSKPHACRLLATMGASAVPERLAAPEIETATRLCNQAAVEGGELHSLPNPPAHGTWDEHQKLWQLTFNAPKALPAGEAAALLHPQDSDDASFCRARIDQGDNLAAQPREVAARYLRYAYASEEDTGFGPHPTAAPPAKGDPPSNLICARAGTRFTLSMAERDGRPITWTSLGQRGWDCALQSSATGLRGIWTSLTADNGNALRLLWPLSVGKSAECGCGNQGNDVFRVASYGSYWLPFGWVQAYAIQEDVSGWNGELLYRTTKYWSPELGFQIGQRTRVAHGGWPDGVAPDWQLVAMDAVSG